MKCKIYDDELKKVLPVPCLLLAHTIYPYHLTFVNGGWFPWIKKEEGVFCRCPKPDGLGFAVMPDGKHIRVIEKNNCPLDYEEGQVIKLDIKPGYEKAVRDTPKIYKKKNEKRE